MEPDLAYPRSAPPAGPKGLTRRKLLGAAAVAAAAAGVTVAGLAARRSHRAEARFPPEGDFETVNGQRIHLLDRGPSEAVAVVLIHGASGNLRDFGFGFSEELLRRYRVIAVDRPGHGHSDRGPGDAWRPDLQAGLMREAVLRRGVRRAVVLGHSLGAASAMAWALDAPETVIGVVDVAGAVMPWPSGVDFKYKITSGPFLGRLASNAIGALVTDAFVERQIAEIFAPQAAPPDYPRLVGAPLALRPDTFRYNSQDVERLKPFLAQQSQRYPELVPPVEIVHGLADEIVPARNHAPKLAELAPRANAVLLPEIGHMPHHAARAEVLQAVDRLASG